MQLDYKILFVDDEGFDGYMGGLKDMLKAHLEDNGFYLIPVIARDEHELDSALANDNNYDMIFVDNDFNGNEFGIQFISKVRDTNSYGDIILCTSKADANLIQQINTNRIHYGFYYFKKEEIWNTPSCITDIIDFHLGRELDINVMRGIVMAEVAQFDACILNILKSNIACKPHILAAIKSEAKRRHAKFQEPSADEDIWAMISDPDKSTLIFESSVRKDVLHAYVLKDIMELRECYDSIKDKYGNDILKKRNILAHQIAPILSDDEKKQLRKDIINFRKVFTKICQHFDQAN